MKKLVVATFMVILSLSLVACGGKKEKKEEAPKGEKLALNYGNSEGDGKISVDFYYPKNAGIEVVDTSIFKKTIKNEKKNYQVEFILSQDTTYTSNKESASEEEEYKEFKVGKLKAYSYKDYSSYEEVILLENISENEDRYVTMEISQISPSDDESGKFFKENKELKSILDSIVYNGVVKAKNQDGVICQNGTLGMKDITASNPDSSKYELSQTMGTDKIMTLCTLKDKESASILIDIQQTYGEDSESLDKSVKYGEKTFKYKYKDKKIAGVTVKLAVFDDSDDSYAFRYSGLFEKEGKVYDLFYEADSEIDKAEEVGEKILEGCIENLYVVE